MTLPDLKPFFEWLQIHPYLAGLITYFICFLECLVMIGFLVPGTVFMTAIGTLIGVGVLQFTPIVIWAIAGAITGDVLSFWIGKHYHYHIKNFPLFRRYPKLLRKGETFFDKHGGKSVFFGRFFGPIRAILPFIAGMVRMPWRQFLIADIISAIAWAPSYMLPGILLGQASQQLPTEVATKLIIFAVLLLLFMWLVYAFIKSCYAWFSRLLDKQVAYLWNFTRNHPKLKTITSILTDYRHPHSHAQLALALTCVFCAFGFLLTAFSVAHHGLATYLNEPIYHLMRSLRQQNLDLFFVAMAELSPRILSVFWLLMLGFFLIKRNYWLSLHWGLAGLLSYGFVSSFKHILHFARPLGLVKIPLGASFPSGHTVISISILGFFAVIIAIEKTKNRRLLVYGLTSLIIILIMFSRIYLTAHWFSDVLGGALLGISILAGLTLSYRRKLDYTNISSGKIATIGTLILLLCWGANLVYGYKKLLSNSQLIYTEQTINFTKWWKDAQLQTPIYRLGHFGQKIEVLNIQWTGKLQRIQKHLETQGWHHLPKTKIFNTLYKLSLHVNVPNVPLFISTNAGQAPALTMTKYFPKTHNLLILNLWNSHRIFSNGTPLWLGLVHYHQTWHLQFQPIKKQTVTPTILPADQQLVRDLRSYTVKNVNYPDFHANVLFIK